MINRNPTYFFFINYFYNFKTFKLSFKYHQQKSYFLFFLIIFIILKHLNYPSTIPHRNPTYFFFNYFYNFKTFKLSFKYHQLKSYFLFFLIIFIILKHLNYPSTIPNRNPTYFFLIIFIILKHLNYPSSIIN
jgi:hypothetical protein